MDEISDDENDNILNIIKDNSILQSINNNNNELKYAEKKDEKIQTDNNIDDEIRKRKRKLSYSYELFINISSSTNNNKKKEPLLNQPIEIQIKKPIMPLEISQNINDDDDFDNISLSSDCSL